MASHEIFIYDAILKNSFFETGVSDEMIRDELAKVPEDERVLVRINSPGGDVFQAAAIFTMLSQHKGGVDVQIDGVAASAASYVAMVGETVTIADGAMMMIHNAHMFAFGDSRAMAKAAGLLDKVNENVIRAYVAKSELTEKEAIAAMDEETWFTASEAVEEGLADEVLDTLGVEDFKIPAVFGYKHTPESSNKQLKEAIKASGQEMRSVSNRAVEIELTRLSLKV